MILPIVAYGHPVLRRMCEELDPSYPDLQAVIDNMFETMHAANGVGLAAPQVGLSLRLFIMDPAPLAEEENDPSLADFKMVFINPEMLTEDGDPWDFNEGCLSIPEVREDVRRKPYIHLRYYDRDFNQRVERFSDLPARIIQHEYDHIEGILFVDHLNPLKKRLLKRKLTDISKGKIVVGYKMLFPALKTRRP